MRRVLAASTRCELGPLALPLEPRIENLANLLWDQVSASTTTTAATVGIATTITAASTAASADLTAAISSAGRSAHALAALSTRRSLSGAHGACPLPVHAHIYGRLPF